MKLQLSFPVQPVFVVQRFGDISNNAWYIAHGLVGYQGHNGIDFYAYLGQPVYAAHDGTAYYEIDSQGGHMVVLQTNDQFDYGTDQCYFKTIYMHLCDSSVYPQFKSPVEGNYPLAIKQGDLIGYADNTGLSTGTHLHFGLKTVQKTVEPPFTWYNTQQNNGFAGCIDPAPYLPRHQFNTDLRLGDNSDEVKALQDYLIMNGYMAPIPSPEYGQYGMKTAGAVSLFQSKYKVASAFTLFWNGGKYVGPMTRYYLNSV